MFLFFPTWQSNNNLHCSHFFIANKVYSNKKGSISALVENGCFFFSLNPRVLSCFLSCQVNLECLFAFFLFNWSLNANNLITVPLEHSVGSTGWIPGGTWKFISLLLLSIKDVEGIYITGLMITRFLLSGLGGFLV